MAALNDGRSTASDDAVSARDPGQAIEVIYDWDIASDQITWGANFTALIGGPDIDAFTTGVGYAEHIAAESRSSRFEAVMGSKGQDAGGGVPFKVVYGLLPARRADVATVWVEDCGRWFADSTNRPRRVHGVLRLLPDGGADHDADTASHRDPATGAFTRAHIVDHIGRHLSLSARKTSTFAVLVIGLDLPGEAGEGPVTAAARRLRGEMRGHEIIARLAGARFALLLEECGPEQAAAAAQRLMASAHDGVHAVRTGAVIAPLQGRTAQVLLQFAESALEATRLPDAPNFLIYKPDLAPISPPTQAAPGEAIRSALARNRVLLALQPVVRARGRDVAFYEGLVRISDGATMLLPDQLVPDAERNGLVPLLDRRVIELAFVHLTGDRRLNLSVNASVASLNDPAWLQTLQACCRRRADAARRLTIEITETCVIADFDAMRDLLGKVRQLGVKVALDDFGSGHSSFRNLRELPIDYLKIDGAFAQNLGASEDDRFFIRTLIDLAKNLKLPTVAEWVEDEETARILTEWGVDFLQGHYFGKAELITS